MDTLEKSDSTLINQNFADYESILVDLRFKKVLTLPFEVTKEPLSCLGKENYYVFFSKEDGLLITCETCHDGSILHMAKIYCCHPSSDGSSNYEWAHGKVDFHHTTKNVYISSKDVQQGVRRLVKEYRHHYTLMPKWTNQGGFGIWFLHHRDTKNKDYDYRAINAERWDMLPAYVKEAIPKCNSI